MIRQSAVLLIPLKKWNSDKLVCTNSHTFSSSFYRVNAKWKSEISRLFERHHIRIVLHSQYIYIQCLFTFQTIYRWRIELISVLIASDSNQVVWWKIVCEKNSKFRIIEKKILRIFSSHLQRTIRTLKTIKFN